MEMQQLQFDPLVHVGHPQKVLPYQHFFVIF